jgi:integrase
MKPQKFPIKVGRLKRVSIYQVKNRKAGYEYLNYTVSFSDQGKQVLATFSDLAKAKTHAKQRARELAKGAMSVLSLKREEAAEYRRALELLKPLGLSLIEAAQQAVKSNRGVNQTVTVGTVITELLKDREVQGLSVKYRYNLQRTHFRFGSVFQEARLASLDRPTIKTFLDGLDCRCRGGRRPATARTRNNYRAAIGLVIEHAKVLKYLPKEHDSIEDMLKEYNEAPKPTEVYTPAEIEMLLRAAWEGRWRVLVPFLAIGAFAGVRHEEIVRLDWKDVPLDGGEITIQAGNAKTARRRNIPVAENLARWLVEFKKDFGPICYRRNMAEPLSRFIESESIRKTGFVWKRNALRHSYLSYRLKIIGNVPLVAIEGGNSPAMIERHYKQLVTADAAKAWFAVQPPTGEKIIQMPGQALAK